MTARWRTSKCWLAVRWQWSASGEDGVRYATSDTPLTKPLRSIEIINVKSEKLIEGKKAYSLFAMMNRLMKKSLLVKRS